MCNKGSYELDYDYYVVSKWVWRLSYVFYYVSECPEEETRTLYQQLQDNKEIKEREYEEQNRLR